MSNYSLQLFRNTTTLFENKQAALDSLTANTLANVINKDGVPVLARYNDDGKIKTLVGFYADSFGGSNAHMTIMDFEGAIEDVEKELKGILGTGVTSANTVSKQLEDLSGTTADTSGVTSVNGAKKYADEKIAEELGELDFEGVSDVTVITAVTQVDGLVSAEGANLTSTDKTVKVSGLDLAVNIDGETIVMDSDGKIGVASSAITLSGKDAVKVTTGATGNEISLEIASTDKVLSQTSAGLLANLELKYTPKTDTANGKIELIGKDNTVISTFDTADFTVDGFLDSVAWSTESDKTNVLVFTWNTAAGKTAIEIDLTKYIDTYTNGNGLNLDSATKTFSVKVKDGDKYLTVDGDGVASKGIDEAIAAAVLVETNRATAAEEAIADDVADLKEALGVEGDEPIVPVETQIQNAIDGLDATKSGKTDHVSVTVSQADGVITAVTVAEEDIASESALTAEITARKAIDGINGDTYVVNSGANYISGATSLNDADVKLDSELKKVQEKVDAINVEAAINAAIGALDVTDAADAEKYVSAVSEVDGKIEVTRANLVSEKTNNALEVDEENGGIFLSLIIDCGTY